MADEIIIRDGKEVFLRNGVEIHNPRMIRLYKTNPRIVPVPVDADRPIKGASPGGATIGAISLTASNANSTANTALSNSYAALGDLGNKLNKYGSDILAGTINLQNAGGFTAGSVSVDTYGNVTGTGMAMTSKGLIGVSAGQTMLALTNTGSATYGGSISTAGQVYASGTTTSSHGNAAGVFIGSGSTRGLIATNGAYIAGSVVADAFYQSDGTRALTQSAQLADLAASTPGRTRICQASVYDSSTGSWGPWAYINLFLN